MAIAAVRLGDEAVCKAMSNLASCLRGLREAVYKDKLDSALDRHMFDVASISSASDHE